MYLKYAHRVPRPYPVLASLARMEGGGGYSFVAGRSSLTTNHVSLSTRSVVLTPSRDDCNNFAFITFLPFIEDGGGGAYLICARLHRLTTNHGRVLPSSGKLRSVWEFGKVDTEAFCVVLPLYSWYIPYDRTAGCVFVCSNGILSGGKVVCIRVKDLCAV